MKLLALIAVICISLHAIDATTFKCDDDTATCKTKFGKELQKEFKAMHKTEAKKIFTTYMDKATAHKTDATGDDLKNIEQSIDVVRNCMQKLNDNDDDMTVAQAIQDGTNAMSWEFNGRKSDEPSIKFTKIRDDCLVVIREASRNFGTLWSNMYKGLRDNDRKDFPEYDEVNKNMEWSEGTKDRPFTVTDYIKACKILDEKFDLSYFRAIVKARK